MSAYTLDYTYTAPSALIDGADSRALSLATSGGSTPEGAASHPYFFSGFLERADVYATALLVVARVARTRFYVPPSSLAGALRAADPVVTSTAEGLRFESFSACCGVYARLDVDSSALDASHSAVGVTNVDVNPPLRAALANYVADRVLEAYEVLPLELRSAAEACLPEDRLPQPEEAEAAGTSVEVPSVLLPGVEPGNPSHPSRIWTSSAPSSRRNRTQTPVELPGTNLPALGERTWHVFTTLPRPTSWRRRISGSFVPCARSPANITTTTLRTCLFSAQY